MEETISVKTEDEIRKEFKAKIKSLHKQLVSFKKAILALKETEINEDVLIYILQQSAKRFHTGVPLSSRTIKRLIKGIENIEEYMFLKVEDV